MSRLLEVGTYLEVTHVNKQDFLLFPIQTGDILRINKILGVGAVGREPRIEITGARNLTFTGQWVWWTNTLSLIDMMGMLTNVTINYIPLLESTDEVKAKFVSQCL